MSIPLIKHCVRAVLRHEGVDLPCEVSVLITDDEGVRRLNLDFRGIDKPTDVLSFPMRRFSSPGKFEHGDSLPEPDTGLLSVGDIIISAERAKAQAKEYGHTIRRETAYLTVHSALHLLGYDHIDEGEEKKRMREREEEILMGMGI